MEDLKDELNKCLYRNQPFVFFRKPNSNTIKAIIQIDDSVNLASDFSEPGFVFTPFDDREKSYMIRRNNAINLSFSCKMVAEEPIKKVIESTDNEQRRIYIDLVQKAIDFINNSETEKIVLSRKEIVEKDKIDISVIFEKLLNYYPQAFVHIWFHPMTGLWMGASPEILLEVKDNRFKTMALAGTQSYNGTTDVIWAQKEKQEQQFVTDFIKQKLNDLKLEVSDPVTIKAGSLLHICSVIRGELTSANQLYTLITTLHPTPAVCGIPRDGAKQFILENEKYNREFYTGFLGEIGSGSSNASLYVNLRCMKVNDTNIIIYVGGGITKDSIPEEEWQETCIKSEVIRSVL